MSFTHDRINKSFFLHLISPAYLFTNAKFCHFEEREITRLCKQYYERLIQAEKDKVEYLEKIVKEK